MIASPVPRALVGNREQCVDLGACKKADKSAIVSLAVHREYPLDLRRICGRFEGGVPKERSDCRQTQIARAGTDLAGLLQIVQKSGYKRCVDILESELIG